MQQTINPKSELLLTESPATESEDRIVVSSFPKNNRFLRDDDPFWRVHISGYLRSANVRK
ncbi:MAG: hypothetical protein ACO1O6_00255 [Bacteroidota bacterium]